MYRPPCRFRLAGYAQLQPGFQSSSPNELLRSPFGDEHTLVENTHSVAHLLGLVHVVSSQEHTLGRVTQLPYQLPCSAAADGSKAAVGSSRSSVGGSCSKTRARLRRCFIPVL